MSESKTEAEGEYEPPKVEDKEFDDAKDALYQKKAKIFYSKEGSYKEIGKFTVNFKTSNQFSKKFFKALGNCLSNLLRITRRRFWFELIIPWGTYCSISSFPRHQKSPLSAKTIVLLR